MKIGEFDLDKDVLVIAEIGNNHEGDFALAQEMIGKAAETGAGAVKFQTIIPEKLVSPTDQERIKQLRRFQFSFSQFERLSEVAREENITFLSTPFDTESARFLDSIVPAFKIASGDNTFYPLLDVVAQTGKPILLSGGLCSLEELRRTRDFIYQAWERCRRHGELALLHCVVSYPTPREEANLLAIQELKTLDVTVGYSDHTLGIDAPVLAVALGARIIEKHFTLDKNYSEFRDHKLAADPAELAELVKRVKEVLELLGEGVKDVRKCEIDAVAQVRRSIVAAKDIAPGTVLGMEHVSWVRPAGGLPPGREAEILGKSPRRSLKAGERILPEYLREAEGSASPCQVRD